MFQVGDKIHPVSLSGTSYKDSKLSVENNIATVTPSLKSYLFEFFFQLLAWGAFIFMISIALNDENPESKNFITFVTIFCLSFSAIVRYIFYRIRKIHKFDKNLGVYYPGRRLDNKLAINISEIEKLYLISKEIYSSEKSYTSFELSFCTFDRRRVIIMNHSERYEIQLDANSLSKFLGVSCESLRSGDSYE